MFWFCEYLQVIFPKQTKSSTNRKVSAILLLLMNLYMYGIFSYFGVTPEPPKQARNVSTYSQSSKEKEGCDNAAHKHTHIYKEFHCVQSPESQLTFWKNTFFGGWRVSHPRNQHSLLPACQWTIWHHIPDDKALQNHCLENLQSYKHVSTMNVYIIRSITFKTLKHLHGTVYISQHITTMKIK